MGSNAKSIISKYNGSSWESIGDSNQFSGAHYLSHVVSSTGEDVYATHINSFDSLILLKYTFIYGCTDSTACNYDALANTDDGSCLLPSLLVPTVINTCDSFIWNTTTYTASGIYYDSLINAVGCDSILVLDLTINATQSNTQTITICNGGSFTVGSNIYTTSGTYTDSLLSINGCDSVVVTNLTVFPNSSINNSYTICGGDSVVVGNMVYTTAGTYSIPFQDANGCPASITTVLSVLANPSTDPSFTICSGDSISIGNSTYSSSGTYIDTLTAISGCDSIINTLLTVFNNDTNQQYYSICDGESVQIGNSIYDSAGIYTDSLTNVSGCDSIITTTVNLTPLPQIIIVKNGNDLVVTTTATNLIYLWSTSATDSSITPTLNTVYWLIATDANGCISDTAFFTVDFINAIAEYENSLVRIYPNPTNDKVFVESEENGVVELYNALGERVLLVNKTSLKQEIDISNLANGIYMIKFKSKVFQLVKG